MNKLGWKVLLYVATVLYLVQFKYSEEFSNPAYL